MPRFSSFSYTHPPTHESLPAIKILIAHFVTLTDPHCYTCYTICETSLSRPTYLANIPGFCDMRKHIPSIYRHYRKHCTRLYKADTISPVDKIRSYARRAAWYDDEGEHTHNPFKKIRVNRRRKQHAARDLERGGIEGITTSINIVGKGN